MLKTIGTVNLRFPFIITIFVAYPAKESYASRFVNPKRRHLMKWRPCLLGLFLQNRKIGIITAISSSENDFDAADSSANLGCLLNETERLRRLLNAKHVTFAGVLPSRFRRCGLVREEIEADMTVSVVSKAEEKIRAAEGYPICPIVVFGGEGLVGAKLVGNLRQNGRQVLSIDVTNRHEFPPPHCMEKKSSW